MTAVGWRGWDGWRLGRPSWEGWKAGDYLWRMGDISEANAQLGLWFDASDLDTIGKESEVDPDTAEWLDKSEFKRNGIQPAGGSQPDHILDALGGKAVMHFNGSSDFFELGTGLDFLAGVDHRCYAVVKVHGGFSNIYGAQQGSQGAQSLHIGFRNGSSYRVNYWGNDYYPGYTNFVFGEYNIVRWVWPIGISKSVYANTLLEGMGGAAAGSIEPMASGGHLLNVVGQGYAGVDIAEIGWVIGDVSTELDDKIEASLAWHWDLVNRLRPGHPYEIAPPLVGNK